jgi:hypothetical protein
LADKAEFTEERNPLSIASREAAIRQPGEQIDAAGLAERAFAASKSVGMGWLEISR